MAAYVIVKVSADPKSHFSPQDLYSLPYDDQLASADEISQEESEQLYAEARVFRIPGIKYAGE